MIETRNPQSDARAEKLRNRTFPQKVKKGIFVLEGLNALATTYYFYYFYFFTEKHFGFSAKQNLLLAAAFGFIYTFAAIYCGRFAQKKGNFTSLKIGFAMLGAAILAGAFVKNLWFLIAITAIGNVAMCFTWAPMQATISENEPRHRLKSLVGIYNLTWAGCSAVAYFTGGAMIKNFGWASMFIVPAAIHFFQLAMTFWLEKQTHAPNPQISSATGTSGHPRPGSLLPLFPKGGEGRGEEVRGVGGQICPSPTLENTANNILHPEESNPPLSPKTFLRMALLANPFAYLAINTVIPIIPTLASQLNFSPAYAGIICSVWFFVRAGAFELLRLWPRWHYRFHWLLLAYVGMIAGFALLLTSKTLWLLLAAQVVFGLSLGLIYYSSLFYSMDVGETKSEHGGFHEGMIGLGSCGGPAIGAAALHFFPNSPSSSILAVSILLTIGLLALLYLRLKIPAKATSQAAKRG